MASRKAKKKMQTLVPLSVEQSEYVNVRMRPELKEIIAERADEDRVSMSELMLRATAEFLGVPELGDVPRITRVGRPRKEIA